MKNTSQLVLSKSLKILKSSIKFLNLVFYVVKPDFFSSITSYHAVSKAFISFRLDRFKSLFSRYTVNREFLY